MNALLLAILLSIPGDVNQSGSVNITDVVDLILMLAICVAAIVVAGRI